jgi:hypothetical protein
VTVLAEDELPELAEPVESEEPLLDDELLDVGVGVGVVVVVALEDGDDVLTVLMVVEDPESVCAATTASTATAAVPRTPREAVSLPRSRSARSRSTGVTSFLGAFMNGPPAAAGQAHRQPEPYEASGEHREGR